MSMAAANDSPSNSFSSPQRPAIYPPSGLSTMSAKYRKAITAPAAKAAFSGSACALSTERLVVKNPSKAKPCIKDRVEQPLLIEKTQHAAQAIATKKRRPISLARAQLQRWTGSVHCGGWPPRAQL